MTTGSDTAQRNAARRAFKEAQDRALNDDRLHVFAQCSCGVDGLLVWIDRDEDGSQYWVEWWTTQPGTRLPFLQRVRAAWRLFRNGAAATHELVLSSIAAKRLAVWLLKVSDDAIRVPSPAVVADLITQRDASWNDAEALFGVDTLIDAVVAEAVHAAGFYDGAAFARRWMAQRRPVDDV